MCWRVCSKKKPRRKKATKDITVYKAVLFEGNECKASIHTNFIYVRNISAPRVRIKLEPTWDGSWRVGRGYHAFVDKKRADNFAWYNKGEKIAKFVIPKGTYYLKNRLEYVAESIMFKRYLKRS